MKKLFPRITALSAFVALLVIPVLAQNSTTGSIAGAVTDQTGAVVAGAQVVIKNNGTSTESTVNTTDNGTFNVPSLATGVYTVTVKVMTAGSGSAGDPFAQCKIVRVDADKAPADAARESDPAKRAAAYGKAGLWFDYLDALNQAIAAKPNDDALVQKRAKALAKQRLIWKPDGTITEERKTDARQ